MKPHITKTRKSSRAVSKHQAAKRDTTRREAEPSQG